MTWIFLALLAGSSVLGVAAWARASKRKVDAQAAARRANNRLDIDERDLLAKLRRGQNRADERSDGETEDKSENKSGPES
jgi:hypothetical protein